VEAIKVAKSVVTGGAQEEKSGAPMEL